ncbi:MAG: NADH-quinone oxidoreductase subunit NuoH [Candidatus Zixiibacteriota bacterium]|jgi:NADH-quinone oxidoreductase subunit H
MIIHPILSWLNEWWIGVVTRYGLPGWFVPAAQMVVHAILIAAFIALLVLFLIWLTRKVSAHIQQRLGPMRTGWHGSIQTVADALKLVQKEDTTPRDCDRPVFNIAPFLAFAPTVVAFVVIPFGDGAIIRDLNIGVLFLFAITTINVIAIICGGWASGSKYSIIGGFRSAAQLVSYEVPLVLSVLGVIMLAGTMKMGAIVDAQKSIWFIVYQPLAFVIYVIAATAEVNRTPFDIPEAEQEIIAGFNLEYSGMKFAMFFLAEFANMFLIAAIATTLFLGGWHGPVLPGEVWFMLKSFAIVLLLMFFRWTYPRIRVDQLMSFAWKFLLPLAFLNLIITGLIIVLM